MKLKKPKQSLRLHLKLIAVLPAYNAAKTVNSFFKNFPFKVFDEVILIDDASRDSTYKLARKIKGIKVFKNSKNLGYGGNMKRCLDLALNSGGDIIVEIHPDGEYGFDGINPAIKKITDGADLVLGNRFYKRFSGVRSGMYIWKIPFTKGLTWVGNLILGTKIPDMHQGFRVYSKTFFEKQNYSTFSNDFSFTFDIIVAAAVNKSRIENVPVTSFYQGKKRGVNLKQAITYFLKTLLLLIQFRTNKLMFSVE